MEERRRFPRLGFNVEVECKIINGVESEPGHLQTKNIGAGGICLVSLDEFKVGNNLELIFSLPGITNQIHAVGRVVWLVPFNVGSTLTSRAYDAGIEFVNISDDDREKINQFVLQKLPV